MVLLFQLFFFILVIGSSFFGLGTFFTVVIFSLLFTLANVYTLPLLMLQSSVILGTAVIGFIIATFVSLKKSGKGVKNYINRISQKPGQLNKIIINLILFLALTLFLLFVYLRLFSYSFYMHEGFLLTILKIILFIFKIYFAIFVPIIISTIMEFDNDSSGCLIIGFIMIGILLYISYHIF